jgi:hypothetical protein
VSCDEHRDQTVGGLVGFPVDHFVWIFGVDSGVDSGTCSQGVIGRNSGANCLDLGKVDGIDVAQGDL